MPMLNNGNLFTCAEMTDAVNKLPLAPLRFSRMFEEKGVRTTSVDLELKASRITLIADSPRGGVPEYIHGSRRQVKTLSTAHLAQAAMVAPEDIQDLRSFGTTELATPESVVNDKMQILKRNMDMTREMHRLGAVKGVVMDADGRTPLLNLFDVFDVKQKKQTITFPTMAADTENVILGSILNAKRMAEAAMGGNPYSHFEAVVGSNFYDRLTGHVLVRKYYEEWLSRQADFGDNDYRKRGFTYGSITFYEASEVVGGLRLVEPDKGHIYPVGPGIWKTYNAPAGWMETVNTIGLPFYARMEILQRGRGYEIEVQSNPLTLCIYPEALIELTAR